MFHNVIIMMFLRKKEMLFALQLSESSTDVLFFQKTICLHETWRVDDCFKMFAAAGHLILRHLCSISLEMARVNMN